MNELTAHLRKRCSSHLHCLQPPRRLPPATNELCARSSLPKPLRVACRIRLVHRAAFDFLHIHGDDKPAPWSFPLFKLANFTPRATLTPPDPPLMRTSPFFVRSSHATQLDYPRPPSAVAKSASTHRYVEMSDGTRARVNSLSSSGGWNRSSSSVGVQGRGSRERRRAGAWKWSALWMGCEVRMTLGV